MINKKIDINIATHEYKTIKANMIVCTSCHHQFFQMPRMGYCPVCSCNKMVGIESGYKELVKKD